MSADQSRQGNEARGRRLGGSLLSGEGAPWWQPVLIALGLVAVAGFLWGAIVEETGGDD